MRLIVGLGLVGLACELPTSTQKDGIEPYDPPTFYAAFWQDTESCSGTEGDLTLVSWFRAQAIWHNGQLLRGVWEPPHRITIWLGLEDDETTVRHEMLHDLLRGDPDHLRPAWEACGLVLP